jgi:Domain of unknown function (DUF383)
MFYKVPIIYFPGFSQQINMPTATTNNDQIIEVFSFLGDERTEARFMAIEYVSTISKTHFKLFREHPSALQNIMKMVADDPLTANKALSTLINLTGDVALVHAMATDEFIQSLIIHLILPKNVNADLVCMLLNNLSLHDVVASLLLPAESKTATHRIDNMLEIFSKKEYSFNPSATFSFLGGVFANIAASPQGCKFMLGKSTIDSSMRLSKLVCFTEHEDVMRRGGVISTLKNVAYGINLDNGTGLELMLESSLNLLVYILLPLSGPEDYDDDVYPNNTGNGRNARRAPAP